MTYGRWEWGTFTRDQLETAGAYRVDTDEEDADLYPDGGYVDDVPEAKLYETELADYEERDGGEDLSTE